MKRLPIGADDLIERLLSLPASDGLCILDSSGVGHLGSHLLIAGARSVEVLELTRGDACVTLEEFDKALARTACASIFTLAYDFALKLHSIPVSPTKYASALEPDIFVSNFDVLIVHNYENGQTFLTGNAARFDEIAAAIDTATPTETGPKSKEASTVEFQTAREDYLQSIERIKGHIRSGRTYQTNLTQQIRVSHPDGLAAQDIFTHLRTDHPSPFAAYLQRPSSTVVSASPERFFRISYDDDSASITASPIKGTRPRGQTNSEDDAYRRELLKSEKDRAENTMIVDLTRNDLGRICEFGSVNVDRICEIEEHPTLFHLVSTVTGSVEIQLAPSAIVKALFPCGSITGAPKLSTMQVIEALEPVPRGLSMGSIGCFIPMGFEGLDRTFEMNVAIRTIVVKGGKAVFNVGGGVVYDSDPEAEYAESLLKAKALLAACGVT